MFDLCLKFRQVLSLLNDVLTFSLEYFFILILLKKYNVTNYRKVMENHNIMRILTFFQYLRQNDIINT